MRTKFLKTLTTYPGISVQKIQGKKRDYYSIELQSLWDQLFPNIEYQNCHKL